MAAGAQRVKSLWIEIMIIACFYVQVCFRKNRYTPLVENCRANSLLSNNETQVWGQRKIYPTAVNRRARYGKKIGRYTHAEA